MKKTSLFVILALVVLTTAFASPVLAEETSPNSTPSSRPKLGQMLREIKDARQENKEDRQDDREERRGVIITFHLNRLQYRYNLYNTRFTNISRRIQLRLDELTKAGKDTTAAQTQLNDANSLLSTANKLATSALADFKLAVTQTGDDRTTSLGKARDEAEAARQTFAQLMKAFQQVLQTLRAL